jgi:hypothetical protein
MTSSCSHLKYMFGFWEAKNVHTIVLTNCKTLSTSRDFRKFWGKICQNLNIAVTGSSLEIGGMASPHWWRGLRLQPVSAVYWVGQMGARDYADSDNSIHPRRLGSHRLWVTEIPSVQSLVTSCNMTRAARLPEKKLTTPVTCFFSVTGLLLPVMRSVTHLLGLF